MHNTKLWRMTIIMRDEHIFGSVAMYQASLQGFQCFTFELNGLGKTADQVFKSGGGPVSAK